MRRLDEASRMKGHDRQRRDGLTTVPASFRERIRSFLVIFLNDLRKARTGLLIVLLIYSVLIALISPILKSEEKADSLGQHLQFSVSIVDEANSYFSELIAEVVKDVKYLDQVYFDTFEKAKERLDRNETILFFTIPPDLFEQTRTGSVRESIHLYLNPQKPMEASAIATLIRQYYFAIDRIYSAVFGYQKEYVKLGGDENHSWLQTTKHALNSLSAYFTKDRFVEKGRTPDQSAIYHALSGILVLFAFIPAMGVLYQTSRLHETDLEDRTILIAGRISPAISRVLIGLTWWIALVIPWLIALRIAGVLETLLPTALVLAGVYLFGACLMLFVGRAHAPTVGVFQVGWLIFFALILFGGVFYPTSLFPAWLRAGARFTPMHAPMEAVFTALSEKGSVATNNVLLSFWAVPPAMALGFIRIRRRRLCD
jgi:hypothetical protein